MFALAVLALAVSADPDRSAELSVLLRQIETLPERQSGEVRVVHPGDPFGSRPTEYLYRYAVDGVHYFWQVTNLGQADTELNQSMVWGENERYSFELGRRGGRWLLNWIRPTRWRQPADSRLRPRGGRDYLADSVFSHGYTVEATAAPLSGLLLGQDPTFAVSAVRVERQVYRVTGVRREPTADGVQQFEATVRVSSNGRYAYLVRVQTVRLHPPASRDETRWTHTTREGDDRPDLIRAEWECRHTSPAAERKTCGHTSYKTGPVTDDDRRRMYLPHYGLAEPDIDNWANPADFDPRAGRPAPRPVWWLLLAVPVAYLLLLGRILWRAFTKPLKADP